MNKKRPESALVVVFSSDGYVLLLQRADDPGFWQSVTGSLEEGETALAAAHRELAEETGLTCPDLQDCQQSNLFEIRPMWRSRYPDGTTHNREHVFLAEVPERCDVTLAPDEHLTYRWVPVPQALEELWSETNRAAIEQFLLPRFG